LNEIQFNHLYIIYCTIAFSEGLQLNDMAPEFSVNDQHKKLITLSAELEKCR